MSNYGNIGLGGQVKLGDGGTPGNVGSPTVLNNPVMFDLPDVEAKTVAIANLAMANGFIPHIGGVLEGSKWTFELVYHEADYARLVAAKNLNRAYAVVIPTDGTDTGTGKTLSFNAILTKLSMPTETEKGLMLKGECQVNSLVTVS